MDLPTIVTELHFRGMDQVRIDSALRCLVHVYAVQRFASPEVGTLTEDIVNTYDIGVVQAATELFLEKAKFQGREVFRVKWGCEDAAASVEGDLWEHAAARWEEYLAQLSGKYLGLMMPSSDEEGARVVTNWKLSRELKWFSVEVPRQGWKILSMMEDLTQVAWKLDLAFGYRPFDSSGVSGKRVLLHARAFDTLKERRVAPPDELVKGIRLFKFFSDYDAQTTDFADLLKDCGITLEDVAEQVQRFFDLNLTSKFREGQYPPYFVNEKKKKEFQLAVHGLLGPMDRWLSGPESEAVAKAEQARPEAITSP